MKADNLSTARASARMISVRWDRPAYIYRRLDNGEILIRIEKSSETWLDRAPVELLETVNAQEENNG